MALSEKALQSVNSLDFDTIKEDLITFLSSQEKFRDYNFEGSGMSILLDILAYNTHHMAFYANMLANESFLDSCELRSSAVSLAKSTGYSPRSRRGSEIIVDVRILFDEEAQSVTDFITLVKANLYRITKNDVFSCSFNGKNVYFYSVNTVYFTYEGNDSEGNPIVYARNVLLREGRLKTKTYIVNNQFGEDQRFIIPDQNLDDRSVVVYVRKSQTESDGSTVPWAKSSNIVENTTDSNIFFLQEIYDGKFEVYFGDGVLGNSLSQGNVVLITYSSCAGSENNGIGIGDSLESPVFNYIPSFQTSLTYLTQIKRDSNNKIITSYGGQEKESKTSIKYYAPRLYEAQNRAVTLNDYISVLQANYSGSIRDVHVWGGEDNTPPEYGKVFVSIRPRTGLFLTTQEKLNIENGILEEKNIVSITPKVVDPEYLYISPTIKVKYDPKTLTKTPESLYSSLVSYVRDYGLRNLSFFEKNFYSGEMVKNISNLSSSIKSSTVELSLSKILTPIFNTNFSYSVSFENELTEIESGKYLESSEFFTYGNSPNASNLPSIRAYFKDNGKGKINLYEFGTDSLVRDNLGTVDYTTGTLKLNSLVVLLGSNLEKYDVTIRSRPKDTDIFSRKNTIIEMNYDEITINMIPVSSVRM